MVELIWDGKYDASGKRTAPLRLKLPFQTVETVNESAQQRQLAHDLFSTGYPAEWRNRLIWGDNKYVLPALVVEIEQQGRAVNLQLTDFVIPPDYVPADVQAAISHWSQWIDYWAVDWDNKGDTFHNMWQTYRTRHAARKSLGLRAGHKYESPGEYTIVVKVIDILGNDTTKSLRVKVV